jgi:hypothetical protein
VAADLDEMRIGCPLLQIAMGGDSRLLARVSVDTWALAPSPDLKLHPIWSQAHEALFVKALEHHAAIRRSRA